uniref:RING-type domain-containing protein n=1 Tax=Spongospora subterranea TaxID=70186 RepID=A0A0H5RM60_9EUKA|eukprot:CRZ09784.1 hypothetical protein [Spongospora subterranea]
MVTRSTCRDLKGVWICIVAVVVWTALTATTLTIELSGHIRLMMFMLITFVCVIPIGVYKCFPAPVEAPILSCGTFVDAVLENSHDENQLAYFPSQSIYLSAGNSSSVSSFQSGNFLRWIGTFCRETFRQGISYTSGRSHELEFLIQMDNAIISGFGSVKSSPCEVGGGYSGFSDNKHLVAFVTRFQGCCREFRGVFDDDFSLGMRGVWLIGSGSRAQRGWWRAWPSDVRPSGVAKIYTCQDASNVCALCLDEGAQSPVVACLPCGHVLACKKCMAIVPLCPACRKPISRLEEVDLTGEDPYFPISSELPSTELAGEPTRTMSDIV